jgi:hypothetical protein
MGTTESQPLPGHRAARALLLLFCAGAVGILPLVCFRPDLPAAAPAAYAIPVFLAVLLALAVGVERAGPASAPWWAVLLGVAYIVGGAALDITATVVHTPDLSLEQNPIARLLLDGGHSVAFVYGYAAVCQSLDLAFVSCLWIGLLRHRCAILESLRGSQTLLQVFKGATGGAKLTWRQWCLPLRLSDLPSAYHLLWLLTVAMVAGSMERWYLGAEWYGFLPGARWVVVSGSVSAGLVFYLLWLWQGVRRLQGEAGRPAGPPGG